MDGKEIGLTEPPFEYEGIQEKFIKEKIKCFEERFKNFLNETETDSVKQFPIFKQAIRRVAILHVILEEIMEMVEQKKKKYKEMLIARDGIDIEGNGELPQYKERAIEIDDSPTAYKCTDESIPSSY
mgnify:CR=1 FL=1